MRRPSIDSLTGLRFIAALMVFFSHYTSSGINPTVGRIFDSGYAGVTFFFVLSGFILAYNHQEEFSRSLNGKVLGYAVSRFARIYPLYVIVMLYMWLMVGSPAPLWVYAFALQAWSSNLDVVFGITAPAWSISVEAFLYVVFPVLIYGLSKAGALKTTVRIAWSMVAILVVMIGLALYFMHTGRNALPLSDPSSAHRWLYRMPITRILDFTLGIFAAGYVNTSRSQPTTWIWSTASYAAMACVIGLMAWPENFLSTFSWDSAYAIPFVIVIVGLAKNRQSLAARFFGCRSMVVLGEASYAFYLIHYEFRLLAGDSAAPIGIRMARVIAVLGLTICAAYGLHRLIERPARAFVLSLSGRLYDRAPRMVTLHEPEGRLP